MDASDVIREVTLPIVPDESTAVTVSKTSKAFHACVTDIVDNCFDARTEAQLNGSDVLNVDIIIDDKHGGSVAIRDNACGMTDKQLQDAFTLGRTDKKKRRGMIGYHGFGLKVSSGAIGNVVEVTSQPERGYEKYLVRYDPTELKGWTIQLRTLSAIPGQHGTEVLIPKRKMFVAKWTIEKLLHEIGTCYFDELQSGRVKITVYYGKEKFEGQPIDHKWVENGRWKGHVIVDGIEVPFEVGVVDTPRSVARAKNGFEIFVNGRKIESQFRPVNERGNGLTSHPEASRIYGRIYTTTDVLEMNTDKTAVIRNENFWSMNNQLAVHTLLREAKRLAKKKNAEYHQSQRMPDDSTRRDIIDKMNRVATIEKEKRKRKHVEVREPTGDNPGTREPTGNGSPRKPKRTHPVMRKIRSNIGMFDLHYMQFPEHEVDLTSVSDITEGGVIDITINTAHKNFLAHPDPYIYAYEEAALARMANDIIDVGIDEAFAMRGELLYKFLSLTADEIEDVEDEGISTVEVAAPNPD